MSQTAELRLPSPFDWQQTELDQPEPTKVWCWGRRSGKTQTALIASVIGHGGHKGLKDGLDVVWLVPNFKQGKIVWDQEIIPTFRHFADLNEQEMTCRPPGMGTLYLRSAHTQDAINSIRGMGKNLAGVVADEGAHFDLEYALRYVIRPMLLDRGGWLIVPSTPYAGSYFNTLCQEIRQGIRERSRYSHATCHQNRLLASDAIRDLIAEYPPESPALRQEVFAELLEGGAGFAFPEFNPAIHVRDADVRGNVRWFAGWDWGYDQPGCLHLIAAFPKRLHVRWELYHRQLTPFELGAKCGLEWQHVAWPEFVGYDPSSAAVRDGGPTIVEEFQRGLQATAGPWGAKIALIPAPRGTAQRMTRKTLMHEALRVATGPNGTPLPWAESKLTIHPSCTNLIRTLATIPLDPRHGLDVDTNADDHAYDCLTYALICREPKVAVPIADVPQNRHPGTMITGQRRSRHRSPEVIQRERWAELAAMGQLPGGRYGPSPRSLPTGVSDDWDL